MSVSTFISLRRRCFPLVVFTLWRARHPEKSITPDYPETWWGPAKDGPQREIQIINLINLINYHYLRNSPQYACQHSTEHLEGKCHRRELRESWPEHRYQLISTLWNILKCKTWWMKQTATENNSEADETDFNSQNWEYIFIKHIEVSSNCQTLYIEKGKERKLKTLHLVFSFFQSA